MNLYSQVFNKLSGMEARPNRMNTAGDSQKTVNVTQPSAGGAGIFITKPPSPLTHKEVGG